MVAGMVVGILASLLAQSLMLEPVYLLGPWRDFRHSWAAKSRPCTASPANRKRWPTPATSAALFLTLRWWLGADPLRSVRFSVIGTAIAVGMAILWYFILPIPRGFMVAGTTAIAVQLSAPWIHPRQRHKFKERMVVT